MHLAVKETGRQIENNPTYPSLRRFAIPGANEGVTGRQGEPGRNWLTDVKGQTDLNVFDPALFDTCS